MCTHRSGLYGIESMLAATLQRKATTTSYNTPVCLNIHVLHFSQPFWQLHQSTRTSLLHALQRLASTAVVPNYSSAQPVEGRLLGARLQHRHWRTIHQYRRNSAEQWPMNCTPMRALYILSAGQKTVCSSSSRNHNNTKPDPSEGQTCRAIISTRS